MSVLTHLRDSLPDLSRNERRVAEYILQHPKDIQKLSGEAVSAICNASRSTILRLCQKLGYQGYAEFKFTLLRELESSSYTPPEAKSASGAELNALTCYCEGLLQMQPLINSTLVAELVDALSYANRVISMGVLHSELSARQMAFRLNKLGIDCHPIGDTTLMSSYERILKQGDVAIIFSISGRDSYMRTVSEYRKNRVKIILVTMTPECDLAKQADIVAVLPDFASSSTLYPMDEAIIFFMFIEIVVEALNKKLTALDLG